MRKLIFIFCILSLVITVRGSQVKPLNDTFNAKSSISLFEENKGQVTGVDAEKVSFVYKEGGLSVFLLPNGLAYQFSKTIMPEGYKPPNKFSDLSERKKMDSLKKTAKTETYRMDIELLGTSREALITAEGKSLDYINYYNHDAMDVYSYNTIIYHNIYPNIDWVIYKSANNLKYDFVVKPGGNPKDIKIKTKYVEDLKLNTDGSLSLINKMGTISEQKPISFQENNIIDTKFEVDANIITFDIAEYEKTKTIKIDPAIVWSTYYGGSLFDGGWCTAVDDSDNVFMSGHTTSSSNIASGGYQKTLSGNYDAYLVKFNKYGVRQWATYYGGSEDDDGTFCIVDKYNNIFMGGSTESTSKITYNGFQNTLSGLSDAYFVKFNTNGKRLWATYYGGHSYDYGDACSIDKSGNIYIVGSTTSDSGIAYNGYKNKIYGACSEPFVVKFNSSGSRIWASYYGGGGSDGFSSCTVDDSNNIYIVGGTNSTTYISKGGFQDTFGGGVADAFLTKFDSNGNLKWGTYYGGANDDRAFYCTVDKFFDVYMGGFTSSTAKISYNGHQNKHGGGSYDGFLVKFTSSGSRQWATYFGGSADDGIGSFVPDDSGNLYLCGFTTSASNISYNGFQNTYGGGIDDGFIAKMSSSGTRLWASYFGGDNKEGANYLCFQKSSGSLYMCGGTTSKSNIAYYGFQDKIGGDYDAYLVKFRTKDCNRSYFNFSDSFCQNSTYSFNGKIYNSAGTYYDTLRNSEQCDSIIKLTLNYYNRYTTNIYAAACDSYFFNNQTIYKSGVYVDSLLNTQGCDSLIKLTLNIFKSYSINLSQTSCESYFLNNKTIYKSGTYIDSFISTYGCDSIVILNLKIIHGNSISLYDTSCGSYFFNSKKINQSGIYVDSLLCKNGCDSIITLHLMINPLPSPIIVQTNFDLSTQPFLSYQWKLDSNNIINATSQTYKAIKKGNYSVQVLNSVGCSSTSPAIFISSDAIEILETDINAISFYPNPTSDYMDIISKDKIDKIVIYGMNGERMEILYESKNTESIILDLRQYAAGIYIAEVYTSNYVCRKKISKNN